MSKPKMIAQCETSCVLANYMCLMAAIACEVAGEDISNTVKGTRITDSLMDQISIAQIQKKVQPILEK